MTLDTKSDLLKSVIERLKVQAAELAEIGEDLKAQGVDEVMLTRIKTVECRLETYNDILRDLVK